MKNLLKILHVILALYIFVGVFFGPFSWIRSANFYSEYDTFKNGASVITGQVVAKRTQRGFRSGNDYVTIKFVHMDTIRRKEIEIERPLWQHLYVTKNVDVFYNPKKSDLIKLKMEIEPQFVPPILKKGIGKWLTITGVIFLIVQVVLRKRISTYFGWEMKKR